MLVLGGGPRDSLEAVRKEVWNWVKGQQREVALHVYNLVDPAAAHRLHNSVIVIAVPVAD